MERSWRDGRRRREDLPRPWSTAARSRWRRCRSSRPAGSSPCAPCAGPSRDQSGRPEPDSLARVANRKSAAALGVEPGGDGERLEQRRLPEPFSPTRNVTARGPDSQAPPGAVRLHDRQPEGVVAGVGSGSTRTCCTNPPPALSTCLLRFIDRRTAGGRRHHHLLALTRPGIRGAALSLVPRGGPGSTTSTSRTTTAPPRSVRPRGAERDAGVAREFGAAVPVAEATWIQRWGRGAASSQLTCVAGSCGSPRYSSRRGRDSRRFAVVAQDDFFAASRSVSRAPLSRRRRAPELSRIRCPPVRGCAGRRRPRRGRVAAGRRA